MTEAVSATLRRIPVHQAVPRDVTSGALVAAASVLSVAVGVMAADRGKLSLAVLGVVCFAVVVALAAKAPGAAFSACIALLVLIPVYAAPTVHALPLYPPLILMWALVIAVAACRAQSAGRVTALDVAVVAMFVMMAASTLVTHAPLREIVFPAFVWLGPYMAGRVVASRFGGAVIATRLAQGGVALAPLAIYESFTRHNLFPQFGQPSGAYDVWLQQATRGGVNRVATSFGHPLALGMFLSTAAVFAAWRAVASETRKGRLAWIAGAAVLAFAQALTLSRVAWVVLALGLAPLVIRASLKRLVLTALAVAATACVLSLIPQGAVVHETLASFAGHSANQDLTGTAAYRVSLLRELTRPHDLALIGPSPTLTGRSIDNEYLHFGLEWGIVPALFLFGVAVAAVATAWSLRRSDGAIGVVVAANVIGLLSVAFITQQQLFIWLLIGGLAGRRAVLLRPEDGYT